MPIKTPEQEMKKTLCLALLALTAVWAIARGQEKGPIIVFPAGQTKDFGKVTAGETLKHIFKFNNKGQAPLQILQVRPT
jgi:hypothetical protein